MLPPGRPSSASSSTGVRASRHGSPDGVRYRQSSIGSASTLLSDRSVAAIASAFASAWLPSNSRAGMCSPKHVSVCAPSSRSSGHEDRRIGQRVAVDLARRELRHLAGVRLA